MATLPQSLMVSTQAVANDLGVPVDWLINLVAFESNFDPLAKNPLSSARGLIQFIDATARGLGYESSADLVDQHPTYSSQMYGPVLTYLRRYQPYSSEQELYLAVFYPAARTWPLDKPFPAWVQEVNPGIVTVGDYVQRVQDMGTDIVPAAAAFATAITDHGTTVKVLGIAAGILGLLYLANRS